MKKSLSDNIFFQLFFLSIFVFISRLPFLWAGFGAEEDSWLLALTAKNMALSGNYEMSRAPGHPLQEYLYAFLYNNGLNAFYTNLISALASVIATVFFSLSLRQLNFKHYLFAGFAFGLAFAVATGFFDDPLDFTLDDFAIGSVVASKARYRQITPVADEPFPESMCHRCVHLRVIKSGKGSVFLMCQEPSLPKYPPQPVRLCRLFTPT